jgi:GNAT superfamily N-acetyltransferase
MVGELLEEIMVTIGSPAFRFNTSETAERLVDLMEQEKYFVFVARNQDKSLCGFISLYESYALYAEGAFGTIPELFVRPSWRSSCVGHDLIESGKQLAKQRGWTRLEVTTPLLPEFQRTLDFYQKQGFSISGGRKLKIEI